VLGAEFADVLRMAVRGDEAAFVRLWRDNQPPLLRYLPVRVAAHRGLRTLAARLSATADGTVTR
jgi:hypothetical protein